MGDHFREQEDFALKHGATRRTVLKGILAGAAAGAAGVPAVADASREIHQLTDRERLDACLGEARAILARLHPECGSVTVEYEVSPHGEAFVSLNANLPRQPWTGSGFYELIWDHGKRRDVFHVEQFWSEMDQCWSYWAALLWDGLLIGGREYFTQNSLHILRKIEGMTERDGRWILA